MKKRYTLELQFDVEIDETHLDRNEHSQEHNTHQQALLDAVQQLPETLDLYQRYRIVGELEAMTYDHWYALLLDSISKKNILDPSYEILSPALALLPPQEKQWFEESEQQELFAESIDGFDSCISANLTDIFIVEEDL